MKRKIEILLLSLILTVVVTVGISSATKGLVIQPGDVNGDGAINAKDAVMLAQYLAGWDVILGGDSHTVVIDAAVPASCTQTGLTEGKHCSDCGMILVKQQVVPMTEHDYEDTVVQPTTRADGYTLHKCKVCGDEYKDNFVPAIDSTGLAVEVDTESMTCVITGIGDCADTDINIPEKISGYTVVGVADKAFENQTQIKSIKIPDTVKTLGQRAFNTCRSLACIEIPSSVTSIGSGAFGSCNNLTNVVVPNSVKDIGDAVFANCDNLKSVAIGNRVVSIGHEMFASCSNLTRIVIPESVICIAKSAFSGCSSLTNIEIPNSVMSIGSSAFNGCSSLTSVVVPESVTSVGEGLFSGCISVVEITLPFVGDGNDKMFFGYVFGAPSSGYNSEYVPSSLRKVKIIKEIKIGDGAFYNCSSLTSIEIPDSVTSIGDYAFSGCGSLTSIEIPDSVTSIGSSAFEGCSNLRSVLIPNGVKSIGGYAFYGCNKLTSIEIPDSVISVGGATFWNCDSLTTIKLSNNLISIGDYAFYICDGITSLVLPDGVVSIGYDAFYGCNNLKTVYYIGAAKDWGNINIGSGNSPLTSATRYYYSATQPTESGNYWHYVDGKPTPW